VKKGCFKVTVNVLGTPSREALFNVYDHFLMRYGKREDGMSQQPTSNSNVSEQTLRQAT
jgi:hypothetical protein